MTIKKLRKAVPLQLSDRKQWICWKSEHNDKNPDKPRKTPKSPHTGFNVGVTNKSGYAGIDDAIEAVKEHDLTGIGFVFTAEDDFVGIDLDHCRDPDSGEIEDWAQKIIDTLDSYTEVSPSGTGVHIIIKGKLPSTGRRKGKVEMYEEGRYFTFTGQHIKGTPTDVNDRFDVLLQVHKEHIGGKGGKVIHTALKSKTDRSKIKLKLKKPSGSSKLTSRDEAILFSAKNALNGDKFNILWRGDWEAIKDESEPEKGKYDSQSEADEALCSLLAFHTGSDPEAMDRLFRNSGLMRPKWDKKRGPSGTYGEITIAKAIDFLSNHQRSDRAAVEKVEEVVAAVQEDPAKAVSNILDDKTALTSLATLARTDPATFERSMLELREAGVLAKDINTLKSVVKAEKKKSPLRLVSQEDASPPTLVKETIPKAPVIKKAVVPKGYRVDKTGIKREQVSKVTDEVLFVPISPAPVFIQTKLIEVAEGLEEVRLVWLRDGKWKTMITGRRVISDQREIVSLAANGFPVTSATAKDMIKYLSAYETANPGLPTAKSTVRLGWHDLDGEKVFLLGDSLFKEDDKIGCEIVNSLSKKKVGADKNGDGLLFFRTSDKGDAQAVKGVNRKGKFKEWQKAVDLIKRLPKVKFALLVSITSPFLEVFDAPNFCLDLACGTSKGKTTALKIAASVWGNPDDQSAATVVHSWNSTRVWFERRASTYHNLPFLLDETKRAKYPKMVPELIYDFASGQGKGRGSVKGTAATGSWRSILISTGENKAVNFTAGDGGAHARTISIWGPPFGKESKKKAQAIDQVVALIEDNYGYAGRRVIRHLLKNKDEWSKYKEKYRKYVRRYQKRAGDNGVAKRQAKYYAAICAAGLISRKILGLPFSVTKVVDKIFAKATKELTEADIAAEALRKVYEWACANTSLFYVKDDEDDPDSDKENTHSPYGGWLGAWPGLGQGSISAVNLGTRDTSSEPCWEWIAFLPVKLDKLLRDEGYEPRSIKRSWADRGWIRRGKKSLTVKVNVSSQRVRCVVITREAIEEVNG